MQQMTPRERAEHYATVFPQYPRLRYDERWLDGVWVLGQDYRGSGFHGSYPPGYLKRIRAIFPNEFQGRVLHLCSGSLDKSVGGVRLELNLDRVPLPDVFGDAHHLPFPDGVFDLVVTDIPYTPADAKKYGTPMVNRATVMREAARVLKMGGHLIWLDIRKPMFSKKTLHWWGIIAVVRSTNHAYRATTFYQRRESFMSNARKRITAAAEKIADALATLLGVDEPGVHDAVEGQKKNTKVRETGTDDEDEKPVKRGRGRPPKVKDEDDEDEVPKKKGPKPPVEDEDDEDEDDDDATVPSDAKLEAMKRDELKALALKLKLDAAGKSRDDLVSMLQESRDAKKGKPGKAKAKDEDDEDDDEKPAKKAKKPAADDDDDEDEKPAKKSKKADKDEDAVDPPDEDDYPKTKVMKADIEAFIKLNKQLLRDNGFLGGKAKKGIQPVEHTYDEVMADIDLIKETWADNVWPEIQNGNWKKMKAEADAMDEDDDE